jgi:ABC-type transport system substrate-binding protein
MLHVSAAPGRIGTIPLFGAAASTARTRNCVPALDEKFSKYLASTNRNERKNLATEIQREMLDNYYFVPVFRHAFVNAIGPRVAAKKWQDVFPTNLTSGYAYPWEDVELKETAAAEN